VRDHLDARHHQGLAPERARRLGLRVAVVGGGFGGIGAAAMLDRAGYHDVTVFEKAPRLGGVWNANTYPGAAWGVPAHHNQLWLAPNPRRWPRVATPGG
jgi:cation diffusion facilitator CzcD-associated flavoprotein CzcO